MNIHLYILHVHEYTHTCTCTFAYCVLLHWVSCYIHFFITHVHVHSHGCILFQSLSCSVTCLDVPRAVNESTITVTTLTLNSVRVSWTSPFDSFNNITHYYLNYSVIEDNRAITNTEIRAEQTNEEITGLSVNTNYSVKICATNGVGEGNYSLAVPFVTATSSKIHVQCTNCVCTCNL